MFIYWAGALSYSRPDNVDIESGLLVMIRIFVLVLIVLSLISCSRFSGNSASQDSSVTTATPLPQFTDAQQALDEGDRLLDINETEKAIEAYNQAIALNPDLAEAYFKLGIAYALIESEQRSAIPGEVIEPAADKKRADKAKPESVKAFEKAVELYKRQIDRNPEDDVSYFNLGRSLNKLNEDQDAEQAIEKAVKLKPDDVEYLTELGAIRIKLAYYREAIEPLEKALQLDPENAEAQELFDDAVAGRRRVEYKEKKDGNANSNSNSRPSNSNSAGNLSTNSQPLTNTNSRPVANTARPLPPAANRSANRAANRP
jgi:tetratricopeptide (TPR) repeat protein